MSGGAFNYYNDSLMSELFPCTENSREARKENPFDDRVMSELCYDLLQVIHALDYYKSCDWSELTYREAVKDFKDKWLFKKLQKEVAMRIVMESFDDLRTALLNELNIRSDKVPYKCCCGGGYPSYDYPYGKTRMHCINCGKEILGDSLEDVIKKWNESVMQENFAEKAGENEK